MSEQNRNVSSNPPSNLPPQRPISGRPDPSPPSPSPNPVNPTPTKPLCPPADYLHPHPAMPFVHLLPAVPSRLHRHRYPQHLEPEDGHDNPSPRSDRPSARSPSLPLRQAAGGKRRTRWRVSPKVSVGLMWDWTGLRRSRRRVARMRWSICRRLRPVSVAEFGMTQTGFSARFAPLLTCFCRAALGTSLVLP